MQRTWRRDGLHLLLKDGAARHRLSDESATDRREQWPIQMSLTAANIETTSRPAGAPLETVVRGSSAAPDRRFVDNDDVSCRMFKANWMESLSHVRPWVPHVIFVPVIVAAFAAAWRVDAPGRTAVLVLGALIFWSLTEYVIHRS